MVQHSTACMEKSQFVDLTNARDGPSSHVDWIDYSRELLEEVESA